MSQTCLPPLMPKLEWFAWLTLLCLLPSLFLLIFFWGQPPLTLPQALIPLLFKAYLLLAQLELCGFWLIAFGELWSQP